MARAIDGNELKNRIRHMPRTVNPDLVQYSLVQAIIANMPTLSPPNEPLTVADKNALITRLRDIGADMPDTHTINQAADMLTVLQAENGENINMTCKDCVHYKPCFYANIDNCEYFKDKSKFIELPCKRGNRMSWIKGKYVAQIEINISGDEDTQNLLPFKDFKEALMTKQTGCIETLLQEEFGAIGTVEVRQLYADAWLEETNE